MIMSAREILWRERIEQWYASGLPCLLPVQVQPEPIAPAVTTSAIMLCSERGWTLTL